MTAIGITSLNLRRADVKFTHNFIICIQATRHRNTTVELISRKTFSLAYAWNKEKNCYIQKDGRFLTYTGNCEQKATIGIVKSTLKILPRHNGIIPIKNKGHTIKRTYSILYQYSQDSTKGKEPNMSIIKWHTQHKR